MELQNSTRGILNSRVAQSKVKLETQLQHLIACVQSAILPTIVFRVFRLVHRDTNLQQQHHGTDSRQGRQTTATEGVHLKVVLL